MTQDSAMRFLKSAVRAYLSLWARLVLRARRPLIVGVTGSVGKTTTKEVIAAVLSHPAAQPFVGTVLKSPGNLNDILGLPLAVLGYPDWHSSPGQLVRWLCLAPLRAVRLATFGPFADVLVLEYALSPDGNLAPLVKVAPPTVAVVTTIGPAHLDTFGTLERIALEKGALVRAVPPDGLVVLGADNPFASDMARQTSARVIPAGGMGRDLSDNVARVVGAFLGVPEEIVERAIRERPAVRRRLKFHDIGPFTMIDDTINANPLSMKLALTTLHDRAAAAQRTVAILGFMAELGADSPMYHQEIGDLARAHADLTIGVGALARHYAPRHWFETTEECIRQLPAILQEGDLVLVKGSAAARMELVTGAIRRLAKEWPGVPA